MRNQQRDHWDKLSNLPLNASVIDTHDTLGSKNLYIAQLRTATILEILDEQRRRGPILDFGCGNGGLSQGLATSGRFVVGLDISKNLLSQTKRRGAMDGKACFLQYDGNHIPIATNSIQAATTYVVLTHILEDTHLKQLLQELHRVIMPGGHLIAIEQSTYRRKLNRETWQCRRPLKEWVSLLNSADFHVGTVKLLRYGRFPTTFLVRLGCIPNFMFPHLHKAESLLGSFFGVLPWDYCDTLFIAQKQ